MSMMVKLSTNEAQIVGAALGMALQETAKSVAGLMESDAENSVDDLMKVLSTQHRASTLYVGIWKALGATDEAVAATLADLLGTDNDEEEE